MVYIGGLHVCDETEWITSYWSQINKYNGSCVSLQWDTTSRGNECFKFWINPYNAEVFLHKPWRPKCKTIKNVLFSSFRFIWIQMLWVYDHLKDFNTSSTLSTDVRSWLIKTVLALKWLNYCFDIVNRFFCDVAEILGEVELPSAVNIVEDIKGFPWHVDTKYYNADIHLCITSKRTIGNKAFADSVHAFVVHFDAQEVITHPQTIQYCLIMSLNSEKKKFVIYQQKITKKVDIGVADWM